MGMSRPWSLQVSLPSKMTVLLSSGCRMDFKHWGFKSLSSPLFQSNPSRRSRLGIWHSLSHPKHPGHLEWLVVRFARHLVRSLLDKDLSGNWWYLIVLPFGFNLSVDQIQNDFEIVKNGLSVAGLSTASCSIFYHKVYLTHHLVYQPLGASTSSIRVLGEADTEGTIDVVIADTNLTCPDPEHPAFAAFSELLPGSSPWTAHSFLSRCEPY